MKIQKNESVLDRVIRGILAVVFFLLAAFVFSGFIQVIFYIIAVASLFTAVTGFCALYKILRIDTIKNNKI